MHEKPLTVGGVSLTYLERLDPRIKLVAMLVWAVCIVTASKGRLNASAAYAVLLLLLLATNRRLVGKFAYRFAAALPFILVLCVLLPFFKEGEPAWRWGSLEVTNEGLWAAQRVGAAAVLCIAGIALVWASTSEPELLAGLRGLGLPLLFVGVIGFMLRYLHVLRPELHRLSDARAGRTIGPHGPSAVRSGANLVGALLLRAHDRAERVADAMAARGFDGRWRALRPHHWHAGELACGAAFVALLVLVRLAA